MYPFDRNYQDPILGFIAELHTYKALRIETTPTATMVVGEYAEVMRMLGEMLKWSHDTYGKAVYVTKLIPGYDAQ